MVESSVVDMIESDGQHTDEDIISWNTEESKKVLRDGFHTSSAQVFNERISPARSYSPSSMENGTVNHHTSTTPLLADDDHSSSGSSSHAFLEQYPSEKLKTLVAFMYLLFGFVASAFTLQFVHERVPSMTEDLPLPDVFFDIMPTRFENAFDVCESVGMVLVIFMLMLAAFHKHRLIICRRVFFIMGTLYLYRSCTMYVTTLPVPGMHFKCAAKAHGKISLMMSRAVALLFGGGLTATGSHHLCGDYLFSGHTIVLVISYLVLAEYTPKKWWYLHWLCWLLAAVGIVCILLAHDHYTVDVVIAYLLTTRLFWSYHTMCNAEILKEVSRTNFLSRVWWFPIFRYFEENVPTNGRLPRQYEWPLPWPQRVRTFFGFIRRSPVKGV